MNQLFRSFLIVMMTFWLAVTQNLNPVYASDVSNCKLATSPKLVNSLGFPISKDRLQNGISRIIVIPFKLTDSSEFLLSQVQKREFLEASKLIYTYSSNIAEVKYEFTKTIAIDMSTNDVRNLLLIRAEGFNEQNENKSTWGMLRRLFAIAEQEIDLTLADSIVFVGSSMSLDTEIAEAMMFDSNSATGFRRPLVTKQHKILNAFLLDKPRSADTIAHETLHNFGLTDLYGPRIPSGLSIMASGGNKLLNYEKWVLGWYPDSKVECIDETLSSSSTNNRTLTISTQPEGGLIVIKTSQDSAYMIETSIDSKIGGNLLFYSLKMEERPPIIFYPLNMGLTLYFPIIDNSTIIGTELESSKFNLLVSNADAQKISLNLIPELQKSTVATSNLRQEAATNQKIAADKVASDLKAKQEAEAKVATVKKPRTITCIKGKLSKKVTGVNPKCPAGYKKK